MSDLILRSRRVVLPDGVRSATVHISGDIITAVNDEEPAEAQDLGDRVLMPGLVDTHVHINEPGRTEWEGFASATRAAAAGGVTTLVDMPLNSVPATTHLEGLHAKHAAAEGQCSVDVAFWGGVVPGNTDQLPLLWEAGVLGFKCFLVPSGVDEFPGVTEADLRVALPVLAGLGATLLVHAELPGPILAAADAGGDPRSYDSYLRSRPDAAEVEAVALLIRLCREFNAPIHVVHVASAEVLPLLWRARRAGLPITAETCPHYLSFSAEQIPDGRTEFKCAPPIRAAATREALWLALAEGTLDLVASDHSPCPPEMKGSDGDFFAAWGGIASLQLALPAVWHEAHARGCTLHQLVEWMSAAPARLAGLRARKGSIAVGQQADLVVWNPEAELRVDPARLHHRHPLTPYRDAVLSGVVEATYVRGTLVYDAGEFPGAPSGQILMRGML